MSGKEKGFATFSDFLASKPAERTKPQRREDDIENDLAKLVFLFPDIDREYARMCLANYTQDRVLRVVDKIMDRNFCHYPQYV